MFPDSQDAPSVRSQKPIHFSITTPISAQLPSPEGSIIDRHITAPGTAMPKAPVYKYG
jgi:hypothetical protein